MKTVDLVQGSAEWHAHRAQHDNASDAPAMLGCSPYKTRAELLREKATGITAEVDAGTQRLFNEGHRTEALARPHAEQIIGEDLYPVVGTNGKLSASFDGLTLMEDQNFECKRLNARLRAAMVPGCTGADLPLDYQVQMEQQHMVADKCQRTLFVAAEFAADGSLVEERHCWYTPNPELAKRIAAGWEQFHADLAVYVGPARTEVVVANRVQGLPSVSVIVSGDITIKDNFKAFEVAVRDFLEHRLIRKPKTDQDFADLDVQIKAMKGAEAALDACETQMLAQIQTVDTAKKTKDMLAQLVKENRLMAEKLLDSEKERRRGEIVAVGITGLREHIAALNTRIGKAYMPAVPADFGGAIKGKRNLASMEDAVGTELARAKIEASAIADRIQLNLAVLAAAGPAVGFLFADLAQIVLKQPDDFSVLMHSRINEHNAKEAARLEAERTRIRAEEAAKLEREQAAKQASESAAAATLPAIPPAPPPVAMAGSPAAADPSRACAVDRVVSAPAVRDSRPPLTTGALCERLGFTVNAQFVRSLGFEPVTMNPPRPGTFWRDRDFAPICRAIAKHLLALTEEVAA